MQVKNFTDIKSFLFDNTTVRQTIFKNTFWISLSVGATKLLRMILIIYTARILGATGYGEFAFALAFVSFFVFLFDFGLSNIVTREFSKDMAREKEFSAVLSLKALLGLISLILIFAASFFITSDPKIQKIIWILALFSFVGQIPEIFYAFFRARQKMEYESWAEILQVLFIVSFGFFVLLNFPSVENIAYSYLFSSLVALIPFLLFFHFKFSSLKIYFNIHIWKQFLKTSWPLALASMSGALYGYADSVIMGRWGLITETGWYNAALKIINIVLVPPVIISLIFYPVISKFIKESREKLQKTWNNQMEILVFLGVPIIVMGITLSFKIIDFIYGSDFYPSVLAFKILLIMSGFAFFCASFSQALIAFDQQKKFFLVTFTGVIINIVLNLILIPKFSLYGAAAASAITYFLSLLLYFFFMRKFTSIKPLTSKIFITLAKVIISAGLMFLIISAPLIYNLNVVFSVFIGFTVYLLIFLILELIIRKLTKTPLKLTN